MHGEGVKEFVGDEHGEAVVAVGDLVEGVMPRERDARGVEGGALEGAHGGTRLDEVHAVEAAADGWELADDLGGGKWVSRAEAKGDVRATCRP